MIHFLVVGLFDMKACSQSRNISFMAAICIDEGVGGSQFVMWT
jgi:hypothetical protein